MRKFWNFNNHDWFLTLSAMLLQIIGLLVIYSATFNAKTLVEGVGTINRQLFFFFLGFIIYIFVSTIDPVFYEYRLVRILIFFLNLGLLTFVLVFGDPVRSTNRWIDWGFLRLQPSEYSKIALILLNAGILKNVLTENKQEVSLASIGGDTHLKKKLKKYIKAFTSKHSASYNYAISFFISSLFIALVFIEPALGTSVITAMIVVALMLVVYPDQKKLFAIIIAFLLTINLTSNFINLQAIYANLGASLMFGSFDLGLFFISLIVLIIVTGISETHIFQIVLSIIVGVMAVFSFNYIWQDVLMPYQRERVEVFINPENDPEGGGWQIKQSKIAIGSGRLFGKGFLQGSQSKLRYLPEAYTDFVFAAFAEEFGFLGAFVLFGIYIVLLVRILKIGREASSNFEAIICYGVAVMILVHIFINVGMNLGIMPVTGIPLPLVSYGGSSIMVTMIALGIVQSISMYRDVVDNQESLVITSVDT